MRLGVRLLLFLSREPGAEDYPEGRNEWAPHNALSTLCRVFPDFLDSMRGADVLDYGCGAGCQTVALAGKGAKYVLGIDPNPKALDSARKLARQMDVQTRVEFTEDFSPACRKRFDVVISQNSMEHYPNPGDALGEMKSALKPNGRIFLTFGPPWFAPYGSHMQFFTKVPWVNLVFSERTVMNARMNFRQDGATRYEKVESGLNRMTVAKFEALLRSTGVEFLYCRYDCVKGFRFLGRLPVLRELFINHISCILTEQGESSGLPVVREEKLTKVAAA